MPPPPQSAKEVLTWRDVLAWTAAKTPGAFAEAVDEIMANATPTDAMKTRSLFISLVLSAVVAMIVAEPEALVFD